MRFTRWALLGLVLGAVFVTTCCTRINPGHVGIQVNLYGQDRGVSSYPQVTGFVFYNPITTTIKEYPTFVQTAVWTHDPHEGSPANEEISFNSKEGLVIYGDISLSYQLESDKVPAFYVKFRSDDLNHFTHGFLRNIARDSFNEVASTYTVDELYGVKKEEFLHAVRDRINKEISTFGVRIEQFGFIGAPRLPDAVVAALNGKIKATQDAIRAENELRQAEAEAQKRIAAAEGEAKSNEILTRSLSPSLLEWRRLELQQLSISKWNGVLPQYTGGGAVPFLQLPQAAK